MRDGILREVGGGMQAKLFADASLVKLNGFGRNTKNGGDFLERPAFGHELQDFALPECEGRLSA